MDDQLLQYYERELTYIRAMAAEFARTYPKIAGRLLVDWGYFTDGLVNSLCILRSAPC